jgi:asparagine synthase (glutamine-hydrolysing)
MLSLNGSRISFDGLTKGVRGLEHRGPDGACMWLAEGGRVGLGHTRLSIIDATATQPIRSEDEQRFIIVNGEFYDFDRLRSELQGRGHHFRTRTDSEIALHLYEERRERCLEHLRGEFAFVIWDGVEASLFAARDRFGIKPLFYAEQDGVLYLASEVKALFQAGVRAAWDREAVFDELHGCFAPDRSLFHSVRQLPAGHFMRASAGGIRLERYWDVNYPRASRPPSAADAQAQLERVGELLDESIRHRLRADVPVGYLLSGGLDSSAVLGIAAAASGSGGRAFTVAFDSGDFDESLNARAAAAHANADLTLVRVTEDELASNFADSVWHGEGIQYNAHGTARFLLSRAIQAAGYRAVMGGEGADEAFAGYGFVRAALHPDHAMPFSTSIRLAMAMLLPLREAERSIALTSPLLARLARFAQLPNWAVGRAASWLETLRSLLAPEFAREFRERDPYRSLIRRLDLRRQVFGREPAKKLLYMWLKTVFAQYHMGADRLDMAHGVEVRLPYLDHVLFEHVSRLPVAALAKDGVQKQALRELARPYVPESIYSGAKRPFYAPPSAAVPGSRLNELVQETCRSTTIRSLPFFEQSSTVALLDRLPDLKARDRVSLDPILMVIASLVILHERYRL